MVHKGTSFLYYQKTLDSGLRFIHVPLASPIVYIGVAIGVGTRHEGRREYGLAHFTEHMLFKGTRLRSSEQIIRRLEEVGGELNAYTSKEETILYAICPRVYAKRALQLMADIVQHSVFDEGELKKEQTVVIDEIHSYEDSPSELIWDEFEDILFRGHALGHRILGTERSVSHFSRVGEQRFYNQHYRPENMAVFVHGDVEAESLCNYAAELFAGAPPAEPLRHSYPLWHGELEPKRIVRRKGTHQRHVLMGATAYPLGDERRLGLSLLVNILGGPGMSSRLNMSLREQAGLAYHTECVYTAYSDTGSVVLSFGCAPEHEAKAIALVEEELRRLISEPLDGEALRRAKRQLCGQILVSRDAHENYFLNMGKAFLHHLSIDPIEKTLERINALEAEQLHEIAREIFPPERMTTLIYR